jgi:hypothetical protein
MRLRQLVTFSFLILTLTTGCSMTHGDPKNPKKNAHPVKRYEVTITTNAPGPWDEVKGSLRFEVTNPGCTPEDKFLGVHKMPAGLWEDFELAQVNEKAWKGYFYRDLLQDEDYYGLGVCHWDGTQVAPVFTVHGIAFGSAQMVSEASREPQTRYFRNSDFLVHSPEAHRISDFIATDPEVNQHPEAFFKITITAKEVTP